MYIIHIILSIDIHADIQEVTAIAFFLSSLRELEFTMPQTDDLLDLLDIKVPKLFALPEKTDNGYGVAVEVQGNLSTFVQDYIYLNAIKSGLLQRMSKILLCV